MFSDYSRFVQSKPLLRCSETDEADKKVPGGFQVAAGICLTGVIDVPPEPES